MFRWYFTREPWLGGTGADTVTPDHTLHTHELAFERYENIASEAWSRRHPAFSVQDTPRIATVLQSLELHGARSPVLIPTSYLKDLFEDPCAA